MKDLGYSLGQTWAKKLLEIAQGESPKENASNEEAEEAEETNPFADKEDRPKEKKKPRNHGHRPSTDYSQAKVLTLRTAASIWTESLTLRTAASIWTEPKLRG